MRAQKFLKNSGIDSVIRALSKSFLELFFCGPLHYCTDIIFEEKKCAVFCGFHTQSGVRGLPKLVKNHQKGTKMGDFGHFVKNRPPTSNQGAKIGSRVLF